VVLGISIHQIIKSDKNDLGVIKDMLEPIVHLVFKLFEVDPVSPM
jgi:hypothetical protein